MAGGIVENDPKILAKHCEMFKLGAKRKYDKGLMVGDMWLFELYHHMEDCAVALRAYAELTSADRGK